MRRKALKRRENLLTNPALDFLLLKLIILNALLAMLLKFTFIALKINIANGAKISRDFFHRVALRDVRIKESLIGEKFSASDSFASNFTLASLSMGFEGYVTFEDGATPEALERS
jgi:hypothetical protein